MADWKKIKTEYITTDISQRKLAKKYGVSESALAKKSIKEEWFKQRKQNYSKTTAKAIEKASNNEAKEISAELRVANKLIQAIEKALDDEMVLANTQSLNYLANALSKASSTKRVITGEYNEKERDAYNLNLRKVEADEKRANNESNEDKTITLVLPDEAKEWTV